METPRIDLKTFRKRNGLLQQQLAGILGISRSFISLIENGVNKLPDDKINILLRSSWDLRGFIPAYDRLEAAIKEGKRLNGADYAIPGSEQTIENVRYGRAGIDAEWAVRIAREIPTLNPEWLSSGTGSPFTDGPSVKKPDESSPTWKELYQSALAENTNLKQILAEKDKQIETLNKLLNNEQTNI